MDAGLTNIMIVVGVAMTGMAFTGWLGYLHGRAVEKGQHEL